jgi:hypothetical protein
MRFVLSDALIGRLRDAQDGRGYSDQITEGEDAFLLDPGLGPPTYLTYDGRVLLDMESWDDTPVREALDHEAIPALIVGARKMGVPELLSLLPQPPSDAVPCPRCHGERYANARTEAQPPIMLICPVCSGLGWTR